MATTKQRICQAALQLFNEKGYHNVSLREIAECAGTTIGNLTYHFPKKDILLAAMQTQFQSDFPFDKPLADTPEDLLSDILMTFFIAERNEQEKPFYYENISQFCQDSEAIRKNVSAFRQKLYAYYCNVYGALARSGAATQSFTEESYSHLAYTYILMASFWIAEASPYMDAALPTTPLADAMYHLLRPYIAQAYLPVYDAAYTRYRTQPQLVAQFDHT